MTAQRRSESLQRAAVPVDVVSPQELLRNGVTGPDMLGSLVPALTATPAGGSRSNFFLRGVGNFTANPIFDSAIAFNYDGVYVGRPGSTSGLFYDLERIEVLKGPQGTLYGRNATGGAINVIPVKPKLDQFSGFLTGSYGNYNAVNVQGALNLPIGDRVALRVSGSTTDHDGYLSDGTSDEKTSAVRVQLLGQLTNDLTVRLAADYAHSGGRGTGVNYADAYVFNPGTGQYAVRPGLDPSIGLYDPQSQAFRGTLRAGPAGRNLTDLAPPQYLDNDYYGTNAEIIWNTDLGVLTVIPAYRHGRQNNISDTFGFEARVFENDEQESVEARFAGKRIGIFDYTVGGLYYHETNEGFYAIGQQATINFNAIDQRTSSYAAFARLTAHLTDQFRLVGGIRYTADRKSFNGVGDSETVVCVAPACPTVPLLPLVDFVTQLPIVPPPGGILPVDRTGAIIVRGATINVNAQEPTNKATYRAAAEFDLTPQSLLYGSVETGFRAGGFSIATGYETYQPEYITAYTFGSKNRFFDNRAQLNVEAFYWKYTNQQLATIALDRAGVQGLFTQNIGRSTMYGADVETRYLLTPDTILNAQLQYLNTNYDSFTYQVPTGRAPPYTGCSANIDAANPAFRDVNCAGMPAYNSPKWTLNMGADHTFHLGEYKLVASVDTQYRTSRYVGFEFQPGQLVGSTWTTNAQLTFAPAADRWAITAFVRNLENDRYPVTANTFAIGSALVDITAPPRTYGVRGTVNF